MNYLKRFTQNYYLFTGSRRKLNKKNEELRYTSAETGVKQSANQHFLEAVQCE